MPEVWTDAFIGPVHKPAKDHKCLKGHRIIVVQNVIGKVPEKIAARRFTRHIECVPPPGMDAHRPHRETWINLATVAANIWDGFEEKDNTLLVALDLENAYNRVWQPILADCILQLGISVFWVQWVMSALNTRRCMMKHRTWRSDWTSSELSSVPSTLQYLHSRSGQIKQTVLLAENLC